MVQAPESSPPAAGLVGSLRKLADGLLEAARDRVELFALELHEEKIRIIQLFIWISTAIFSAILAITFASLTLVYLFWETARLAVLGGLALLYAGVFAAVLVNCRKIIMKQPRPFEATIAELQNDRTCIRPQS